jgi:hypothetical protein
MERREPRLWKRTLANLVVGSSRDPRGDLVGVVDVIGEAVPAEIRKRDHVVSLSPRAERPQTFFGAQPVGVGSTSS